MKVSKSKLIGIRSKREGGFTLLEYCAGAAVIAGVVWVAMNSLGVNLGQFLDRLGQWTTQRTGEIQVQDSSS